MLPWVFQVNKFKSLINSAKNLLNPIQDGHFRGWSLIGGAKRPLLPKICHTYPTMMKLGTVIPYLKKIEKIYEPRDTPPLFF